MATVFFSQRSWQKLGLCGPFGAAHRSALRGSGIAEEGEYARDMTKFHVKSPISRLVMLSDFLKKYLWPGAFHLSIILTKLNHFAAQGAPSNKIL